MLERKIRGVTMICPHCGYDMGNKNKCLRCGYEVKDVAVSDGRERKDGHKKDDPETIVIDPCNVYLTHPYGYEDDDGVDYDPFADLFGNLFNDPISDLLGGLFGFDLNPFGRSSRRTVVDEPPPKKKKQGPIYVVDDVEILDSHDRPVEADEYNPKPKRKTEQSEGGAKHKNPFKRSNGNGDKK